MPVGAADEVEDLIRSLRPSVVVIRSSDRSGDARGLGSGFVVGDGGLIATNFHVIGARRRFSVEFADGRSFAPIEIVASDERLDLAVIRIDAADLVPLRLGDSDSLRPGQTVASLGNPLGFEFSATRGVIAEPSRELDGRTLVQIAMPIEPGSSGSPLVDLAGAVVGVVAIKSGAALGFACRSNDLARLIASPRPVAYERWLTVGALDAAEWQSVMGGAWRQRAGQLIASGSGDGFGGRMLCLSTETLPSEGFEVEVEVKLDDESGAAGLVFHADGADRHYGFYPTAGSLRLTRFDGPDVFSWTILTTFPHAEYRPGDWNRIKVRVEGAKITCFLRDEQVYETTDEGLEPGRVGLVKFRDPSARFRRFRAAARLETRGSPPELAARVGELVKALDDEAASRAIAGELAEIDGDAADAVMRAARDLERRAERLRSIAAEVRHRRNTTDLAALFEQGGDDVDLIHAALLVARSDNHELEIDVYTRKVDRIAVRVRSRLDGDAPASAIFDALMDVFFNEYGFHGSTYEYYDRSNSYVNEVLDDREGIPITLSVVFIEVARRLGLAMAGVGIPRHFIVEHRPAGGEVRLVDVFGGRVITRSEAEGLAGQPLSDAHFEPTDKRGIIARMLRNLFSLAESEKDPASALRYVDLILAIEPDSVLDRLHRSRLRYFGADRASAAEDLDWLLEKQPIGVDLEGIRALRESLRDAADS